MHSVNLLDYAFISSLGNMQESVNAIKKSQVDVSTKEVASFGEQVKVPYFLLQEQTQDNSEYIAGLIKKVVLEISSKLSKEKKKKTALLIGTALVDINLINSVELGDADSEYPNNKKSIDSYAFDISEELGLNNFTMSIGTACTSSINAVIEARNLINSGVFDYAIVVGVEVFSQMLSDGFSSMNLFSFSKQRPFDNQRDGLILGEGVAAVLVGKDDSNWKFRGAYSNCNSQTITSVSDSGDEFTEVMQSALDLADVEAKEIRAIKAHATSTLSNDLAELKAIKRVFDKSVAFSVLKPYIGHTLGACGVLEMALMMGCIDDGFLPKTLGHEDSMDEEYKPLLEHQKCENGIFMLNYFGFGGNNTTAIIEKR